MCLYFYSYTNYTWKYTCTWLSHDCTVTSSFVESSIPPWVVLIQGSAILTLISPETSIELELIVQWDIKWYHKNWIYVYHKWYNYVPALSDKLSSAWMISTSEERISPWIVRGVTELSIFISVSKFFNLSSIWNR